MRTTKRKALGQHFLSNRHILAKIIKVIDPQPQDTILEIGAGKGKLTFPLALRSGQVIAIEKDKTLIPFLERKDMPNLRILNEDVLKLDFLGLGLPEKVKIVGNLPYSISAPFLFKVFQNKPLFSLCVFLIQKEVAERLCSSPGTKKFAPLTILFSNHFETRLHFKVSPQAFSPPPKVDSALVSLKKRIHPIINFQDETLFHQFIKGAFRHRRKTLVNNLKSMDFHASTIKTAFSNAGIESNTRPEQVSLELFAALFLSLHE
jgi:16S rRNA (adenine1518-N6/adenine1519-N6)-dimethyltransferase